MKNLKLRLLLINVCLMAWLGATAVSAQTGSSTDLLSTLPTSDVVGTVDAKRILTEIIPRLLAKDPATLAKMLMTANELKTKTGINILGIERIAAGMQFVGPATHEMKKEDFGLVISIRGDFDAGKLVAFVKSESKGKQREESYGGKTIYSEPEMDGTKKKAERERAAITILDANTVLIGDLPQVRAAVDAAGGKGRVDPALVALAMRDTGSLIGVAGNVPDGLAEDLGSLAPGNDDSAQAFKKAIAAIKQVFGSLGATPAEFNVTVGLRLGSAEQAQSVNDMLLGLRQQALQAVPGKDERDFVEGVQISAQDDQVLVKSKVPNELVQEFTTSMVKENAPRKPETARQQATKVVQGKAKQTTARSRRTRRRKH